MANLPQQNTIVQYQADGVTDSYAYSFYVPLDGDINVYVTPVGDVPLPSQDIKILNTDYNVSFNVNKFTGGYITFLPGKIPAIGTTVTLSRDVDASLDVEFANATTLNGENLDEAFERLLLLIQQNKTLINSAQQRVLSYVVNAFQTPANISAQTQLPVLADNQIWVGTGTGIEAVTVDENPSISTLRTQLLDAASGQDGARRVGYYDAVSSTPTTVQAFLANLIPFIQTNIPIPSGMMSDFAGTVAPSGWLVCDGSAVSRTTYASLFTAIGTAWGVGDGVLTFNLPNLARRTTVGSGGTGTATLGNAVGNVGGEETHVLTVTEMPSHNHPGSVYPFGYRGGSSGSGISSLSDSGGSAGLNITTQGGDGAHNNIQPSAVVTKIIKI